MNEKSVKSYEIVLENCEEIILSKLDLIESNFWGVDKNIDIYQQEEQTLKREVLCAKEAVLTFDIEKLKTRQTSFSDGEYNAYERLTKHLDIVALNVIYEDDSNDLIYVPYDGEYENKLQENITEKILEKDCLKIYFGDK